MPYRVRRLFGPNGKGKGWKKRAQNPLALFLDLSLFVPPILSLSFYQIEDPSCLVSTVKK
jgi:hypothetical protein